MSRDALTKSWWLLFPAFSALTIALATERACSNPYDLLPGLTSNPAWAWPLAALYVAAHVWIVAAYLLTVSATDDLLPGITGFRAVWGGALAQVVLMLAAFAIEYSPLPMWRMIGAGLHCAR